MTDYIGKYVKKFESGSYGSLALSSCGYDWGLSCGSYQLTLRWGNCINFLKKYFPSDAAGLFYNTAMKDFASKTWPGNAYCSSPDSVKSVWQKCYNRVGADQFFEYEHAWIEAQYYTPIKNKVKDILNLDTVDRAFQECFWSWAVHKGSGGANTAFRAVLSNNKISSLNFIDKETLFDYIYDHRYNDAGTNRYKKGLMNGSSEREILRPLITKGTFSGGINPGNIEVTAPVTPKVEPPKVEEKKEEKPKEIKVNSLNGTLKVILRNDVLNVRSSPYFIDNIVDRYSYGKIVSVVGITEDKQFYKLSDGNYISTNTSYVQFTETKNQTGFLVRVKAGNLEIKKVPALIGVTVGTINQNGVFTIVEEQAGYGRLKSGAGWISLDSKLVTRLN